MFAASLLSAWFFPLIACGLVGGALFVLLWTVISSLHSEDLEQDQAWRYDVNRINEFRKADFLYRVFQPLIQWFARLNRGLFREYLPEIGREIQAAGLPRFWTPEEYLGRCELIALLLGPAYLYVCVDFMGGPGS